MQQLEDALSSEFDTVRIIQTESRRITWIRNNLSITSYLDLETSIRFCGSHNDAPVYYRKLDDFISNHKLTITGFSKEITMIDYGITNDTSQFVTEIQIPIATE